MLSLLWISGPALVGYLLLRDWWNQAYAPADKRWGDGGED